MSMTTEQRQIAIAELIDNLLYYNAWRRGEHNDMPEPKDIGVWLDAACDELEKLLKIKRIFKP